uniref:Kanadaptin-like n=1 Tax=Dermatophagoides pteronyssinus TaxID=6956 RepID=A0A6P6YD32_DERPT|nr:kanadaptin-like [Dermatophagoides pteronyssinus]
MENDNDNDDNGGSEIPNESSKDPESSNDHLSTTTIINKTILPEPLTKLLPPKNIYFIEQMKNGLSIANILINEKNRLIFGRARDCDIPMDHPSISRYHAALLWAPKNDDDYKNGTNTESFWYLIDCGSTHGTICNKKSIDPGKMIKIIPNNNVFRFGASTRLFTLGSSHEDSNDDDSDDSNEELNNQQVTKRTKEEQDTDDACTWGISLTDCTEDDDEEIGDSLALKSIIMAMKDGQSSSSTTSKLQSTNENVYSDNPYKCLQQWFENEGYDFDYKVDSLHNKFKCTFDLPIDGQWIPVDGQLMTRKKESIQDACLRCCRLLDQANLLFAWQRKDSAREKARKEFYNNDDDDDLLDETIKPATKKLRKDSEGKIETYDSLNLKWKEINQELCQLKVRLAHIGLEPGVTPEISQDLIGDSLDIYMNSLNQKKYGLSMNEKIEKSNLKIKIKQLETEQSKIEKLIQLARPAEIVMKNLTTSTEPTKESKNDENAIQMEKKLINKEEESNEKFIESSKNSVADDNSDGKSETVENSSNSEKKKNYKEFRKIRQQSTIEAIEREKRLEKQRQQQQQKQQQLQQQSIETDDDFVDLVRLDQQQQTGDGRTHLNEKFGY